MPEPAPVASGRGAARDLAELVALRTAFAVLGRLPEASATRVGGGIGRLAYRILGRRRRIALSNLARVWPDRPEEERARIARASFESLGRLVAEFARFPRLDRAWVESHVRYEGLDTYLELKARGRGVLYLAAHYGAWELIPYAQSLLGHTMSFIVRPADNPRAESLVRRYRERRGNVAIAKRSALLECLRRLRAGETVGMLIDQHVPEEHGVPGTLLGQPVYTTSALAILALLTGAPVLPAFAQREADGCHRIVLGPEVEVTRSGDRDRDLIATTERFNRVVERYIEERPELWLWSHRRFRSPGGAVRLTGPTNAG